MNKIIKFAGRLIILTTFLFAFINSNYYAATTFKAVSTLKTTTPLKRDQAFSLLKKAFNVQLSLGQTPRTQADIKLILAPYFTSQYTEFFINKCMENNGQGWYVPASDVMNGFVPQFSYNAKTKLIPSKDRKSTYVIEEFPANQEGPVAWDEHIERVTIKKTKHGWRIDLIEWLK